MYSSGYFSSSVRPNPYNSAYSLASESYDIHNNQFYSQKIFDDHRLERKMLERPAFLIKQEPLYPDSETYRIGSALDYADSLTRPKTNKFYSSAAQEERVRIQGVNPFHQANPYLEVQSKQSYLKRSTRSRLDTNPNLGVTSYEILKQPQSQYLNSSHRQRSPQTIDFSSIKKERNDIEQYIAKSILENENRKISERSAFSYQQNPTIRQEPESRQDVLRSTKQNIRPPMSKKTTSTIVKPKENPQSIIYKGKKYASIMV